METALYILLGLLAALALAAYVTYARFKATQNLLVALDQRCDTALADVDLHLKHRHNLIPGLVDIVKGMKSHEQEMVLGVIEARAAALGQMTADIRLKAEGNLTARLDTLIASVDKLPEIRALPEFLNLRRELTDCENRITAARRFHNLATEEYNTALRMFPANIVATKLHMNSRPIYDLGGERALMDAPMAMQF